ncbi:MAG: beta-ketoacyl synthase [Dysgonamonadaceae bacterium]|jgi:3-oxoacyl-[acyl-carrier-protein] synthase-1|nr:beta-ketoacyl synthase [Dysgonamonadaceae bacterium]
MMNVLGTNIISSLGFTTAKNFENVKRGVSGLKRYEANTLYDLPEAFVASLIDKERLNDECSNAKLSGLATNLEKAAILSVLDANKQANIDLSGEKTIFVLSTTKGNVDLLDDTETKRTLALPVFLWHTSKTIARFFGNPNVPIVVSNACISGAAAQITAMRELENGPFDYAVVVGADFLSKFIISGFQSFKALSPDICRPFDKERCGLNLGEAVATIIYGRKMQNTKHRVCLINGVIRNDANHISGPSRTGEGSFRALRNIIENIDKEQIAFINAHGTATSYNDAMEAVAIGRAGLQSAPVNSLKGYYGHTLGAAGVLESIVSMCALQENRALKSFNYNEQNFENPINILRENHLSNKRYFIKLLSGFGGVNAAVLFEKNADCN